MNLSLKRIGLALLTAAVAGAAQAANIEVVWKGGASGSFHEASNWDPAVVPSSETQAGYVAVFTNSVALTASDWWWPAGLKVSGNAAVTFDLGTMRFMPSKKGEDSWLVFDVETGSSFDLTTSSNIYGNDKLSFKKTGGGAVKMSGAVVLTMDDKFFDTLDIAGGTLDMPAVGAQNGITVRDGAILVVRTEGGLARGNYPPYLVTVEAGGTLDCGGNRHWIGSIAGGGEITNTGSGLYLNLGFSGATFSGKVHGKLIVAPAASVTSQGAYVVIGARDTLADANFTYTPAAGVETSVKFAPNVGIFVAKTYPSGTFYDTDGKPVELCPQAVFVDAARPDDSGDGKDWSTAYRTLAAAFVKSAPVQYAKVFVKPGTYDEGAMLKGLTDTVSNRVVVSKNVMVKSVGSATNTFIVGAPSPTPIGGKEGCGPNATRGVYLLSGASLRGFTITGGRTTTSDNGGGVVMEDTTCRLVDCVLTNNVANRGGAGAGGSYVRCRVVGNKATSNLGHGIIYTVKAYNCFFDANGTGGTGHYVANNYAEFYNCTFGPNDYAIDARQVKAGVEKSCQAYNSIFMTPLTSQTVPGVIDLHNCLVLAGTNTFAYVDSTTYVTKYATAADMLAYAGLDADLRAGPDGSAFDGGDPTLYAVPDGEDAALDGNREKRVSNGRLDLGASEFDAESTYVTVAVPAHDGVTITGVTPGETVKVTPGETLTYTLSRSLTSEKLCAGFRVNGQFHSFDDYPDGYVHTVTGAGYQFSESVEVVFNEIQPDWYVDPVGGNDGNRGYHALCPWKTLTNAMARAQSGSTVHAAAGFYTNSLMTVGTDVTTNRVVVPAGVTLQATEGPEKTFILGLGAGADLRCAYLNENASIRGFTLANGRTSDVGGGVWAADKTCVIADCIISNNVSSYRGGGGCHGTYIGCRILSNTAGLSSAIYLGCDLQDCVIDGNNGTSCYIAGNPSTIVNCTFGPNESGNLRAMSNGGKTTHVYDSVFLAPPVGDSGGIVFHNCRLYAGNATGLECQDGTTVTNITDVAQRLAAAGVDPVTLRPLVDSPLVDAGLGTNRFVVDVPAQDAAGGQRVYNRTIDIGGFEHDWRGDFARCLSTSPSLTVTAAGANVTTNVAAGVLVPAGEPLACRWTNARGREKAHALSVAMTGAGTLVCRLNGQELGRVTAADGQAELSFKNAETVNDLTFDIEGDGAAVVSDFTRRGTDGLLIQVR